MRPTNLQRPYKRAALHVRVSSESDYYLLRMISATRLTLLAVIGMSLYARVAGVTWSYDGELGPDEWVNEFPLCGGSRQSPIDFNPLTVGRRLWLPFVFRNYEKVQMTSLLENGHTAMLEMPAGFPVAQRPNFRGGGLSGRYIFEQLHFHWGADDTTGSEHTVAGRSYSGELHLVHYNSKYANIGEAAAYKDGIAVLGIFLQASPFENQGLKPIINHLEKVRHAGSSVILDETVNFMQLLPRKSFKFYRYLGSLTTPGCDEVVTWTVFRAPSFLTSAQLEQFRALKDDNGEPLRLTNRPVQPVNDRGVLTQLI